MTFYRKDYIPWNQFIQLPPLRRTTNKPYQTHGPHGLDPPPIRLRAGGTSQVYRVPTPPGPSPQVVRPPWHPPQPSPQVLGALGGSHRHSSSSQLVTAPGLQFGDPLLLLPTVELSSWGLFRLESPAHLRETTQKQHAIQEACDDSV